MAEPVRYSDAVTVRCQPEVAAMVDQAAIKRGMKPAEWVRQTVLTGLRLDGFDPAATAPRDAGTLYNVVEGKRCYALLSGDHIVGMSYHASEPAVSDYAPGRGDRVLPVEHQDSEPFDISTHWRLPPIDTLEADRVVRTFPIIPKSLEAM